MKTKVKRFSKRSLAVFLGVMMLISAIGFGSIISASADTGHKVYMCPANLGWTNYSQFKLYVKDNGGGSGSTDYVADMTKCDNTIQGKDVYYVTIYEKYGGWSTFEFQAFSNGNCKSRYGAKSDSWLFASGVDGKVYNGYSNGSHHWDTPNWDQDYYLRGTINGVNCWSSNTYSNTYKFSTTDYTTYSVQVTLRTGDEMKVFNGASSTWYGHSSSGYNLSTTENGSTLSSPGQNFKAPGAGVYTIYWVPSTNKAWAVAASSSYYLTGFFDGAEKTSHSGTTYGFTKVSDDKYTFEHNFTADTSGKQYVTVTTSSGTTWHAPTKNASSGTGGGTSNSSPNSDNKWMVSAASGKTVTFTWVPSTHTLSWVVSASSWTDSSSAWIIHATNDALSNNTTTFRPKTSTSENYMVAVIDVSSAAIGSNYFLAISDSNSDKTKIWNHNSGDTVEVISNSTSPFSSTGPQSHTFSSTNCTFARYSLRAIPSSGKISVKIWQTNNGTALHYQFFDGDLTTSNTDDGDLSITYYAKDGVVRYDKNCSALFGTTTVTGSDYVTTGTRVTAGDENQGWREGTATKGQSITVSTEVSASYSKYYVVGYSFNGVTPHILDAQGTSGDNTARTYTDTWEIPEDYTYTKLEITPIYFLKDSSNTVTFFIDDYTKDVQNAGWGDTLYIYPFYQYYRNGTSGTTTTYDGQAGNYRAYPGQPVVNNNGQRYAQIPLDDEGDGTGYRVKGITINNGYWDDVHGTSESDKMNQTSKGANFITTHHQTYDYDDFYKIYKENVSDINSIKFKFKYETAHENRELIPRKSGDNFYAGLGTSNQITTSNCNSWLNYNNYSNSVAESTLTSTYTNGWEDYTDDHERKVDLFGTVLTSSQISANSAHPIRVISTGYQYNNAGSFGTEWIVYRYDSSANTYIKVVAASGGRTSIVPSALVLSADNNYADFSSTGTYKALDGDLGVSDYLNMYKALEAYRGYPVVITYESDILGGVKKGDNEIEYDEANRCDGRWTYTKKTDEIQAKMKIEFTNASNTSWTADTQNASTGVGTTTNTKAYFTDGDAKSKIDTGKVLIDNDSYFNFKAETAGNYEFVGWGLENANGDISSYETMNNTELTGKTLRSRNVTVVARFQYVTSGRLSISHNLNSSSTDTGTTYLGVTINDGNSDITIADVATNTSSVTLGNKYIKSNYSDYRITVTLKTVPNGENQFKGFSANKIDPSGTPSSITTGQTFFDGNNSPASPGAGATVTRTITFDVGDLFTNTTQNYTALEYLSEITPSVNKYVINYTYNSRLYGSKMFTKKGTFTDAELNSYLKEGSGENKKFKTSLISAKAPKESNFNEDITWNTSNLDSNTTGSQSGSEYTFTINVSSTASASNERTGTFYVPYDFSTDAKDRYYPSNVNTDLGYKKVNKTDYQHFDITTTYKGYFETGASGNEYHSQHGEHQTFVMAPDAVYDSAKDETKFFSYWLIETADGKREIAKCFFNEFNYRAYDNYKVTAVYNSNTRGEFLDLYNNNINSTTISFLGHSRNQWNDGTGTTTSKTPGYASADLIFNDFAVSFNYGNQFISESDNDVSVGIVVQRVQGIELDSTGSHGTSIETYEENNIGSVETARTNVAKYVKGESTSGFVAFKQSIAKSEVNNKNRTQQYVALYNAINWNESDQAFTNPSTLKDFVYRAFSYIKIGSNVYVSEKPAYFCMYNTATAK